MGKVTTGFSMSLDGFIARPNNEIGPLFDWYSSGGGEQEVPIGEGTIKMSTTGAEYIKEASAAAGALVTGRTLFDFTNAWGGRHPLDVPVVVLTHHPETIAPEWRKEGSPFTFVTEGIERAIERAQAIAGEKNVAVASASLVQQCLTAGLLDEIHIDLVPVLLGEGKRLFGHLDSELKLESTAATATPGVLHLTFRIIK
jgi:dihydrofolate reductase